MTDEEKVQALFLKLLRDGAMLFARTATAYFLEERRKHGAPPIDVYQHVMLQALVLGRSYVLSDSKCKSLPCWWDVQRVLIPVNGKVRKSYKRWMRHCLAAGEENTALLDSLDDLLKAAIKWEEWEEKLGAK